MQKSTKKLSVSALAAAIAVALLCISAVMPTGKLAFAAVAGIGTAAVLIECGAVWSLLCFASAALLGALLAPDKASAAMYIVFFGYYPLVKGLIEKKRFPIALEWVLKLLVFNAAFALIFAMWKLGFVQVGFEKGYAIPILVAAGNFLFAVYDYGFSKLIGFYIRRVSRHIKKR